MFDLLSEDTIRLEEAARIGKVHFSSAYRWVLRGVPGPDGQRVRLEAIRVGRAWLTSKQAWQDSQRRSRPHGIATQPLPSGQRALGGAPASARLRPWLNKGFEKLEVEKAGLRGSIGRKLKEAHRDYAARAYSRGR